MEDKNVQKLLDMLFGMIDEAKGATFSSEKCVINRDEALDLLDEIRNKLPGELTKAQELMKSKEQYVDKANHEVRRMLDQAQDEAKRLREQAQAEAKRMLEKAQEDAKTIVSESETIQRAQRRSSEINQMMKVIGEEGTSAEDYILYQKGELLDAVYLQQNSFDPIDAACEPERQAHEFNVLYDVLTRDYALSDKKEIRAFFNQVRQEFLDWHGTVYGTPEFAAQETKLADLYRSKVTG